MNSLPGRLRRAWRALPPERRLAGGAALGLFVTLFLPWYQETVIAGGRSVSATLTGWGAFSFVEAAVLLVAAGVLALLFSRAEGRRFHLPGGDGGVILAAGAWTGFLVIWRVLDKQGAHVSGTGIADSGVEWGIFVTLALAVALAVAGSRIRAAGTPEPALGDEDYDFSLPPRGARQPPRGAPQPPRGPRQPPRGAGRPTPAPDLTATRVRRRDRPSGTGTVSFPTPDTLADPPSLRLGREPVDRRRGPVADEDDQLTIPFDEPDR